MLKLKPKIQKILDKIKDDPKNDANYDRIREYGGGSDGFWYDLTDGGYFKPEDVLANKEDVKRVEGAIKLLQELEEVYEQLTPEF